MKMYRAVGVLLSFLFSISEPAFAAKRVAFVVGIDAYDNLPADKQLKKARSDGAAVARTLKELSFDVIARDNLTRSAFNAAWVEFVSMLEPDDTAAFYFAGHGVELNGQNYLLLRDVPSIEPKAVGLVKKESISLQDLLEELRSKSTGLNLVILDACRDNPFPRTASRSVGGAKGLVVTEPPEGTFIIYSAGTGETAIDHLGDTDKDPNSVFTRHLLPLLKTRNLSLTDLAKEVRLGVGKLASTVRHQQTPAYYDQVVGRVCLAGCAELRPVPKFTIVAPDARSLEHGSSVSIKIRIEPTPDPVTAQRVIVNGRLVEEWVPDAGSAGFDGVERVFDVPLARGSNRIRVTLGNAVGDKTESLLLNHEGEGTLDKRGTLYVLAIGIDKYEDPSIPSLAFASSDAHRIAYAVVKRLGPAHAHIVTRVLANGRTPHDEPTAANITEALDMFRQATAVDTLLMFVAGISTNDGQVGVLYATDTRMSGKIVRRSTAIQWRAIQESLENAKGLRLCIIDTNVAGRTFNTMPSNSVITFTAGGWNQNTFELGTLQAGLFTYAFVEALEGKAATGKRELTTGDIAKYVGERVRALARNLGEQQEPQYFSGGDAEEDHVLVP